MALLRSDETDAQGHSLVLKWLCNPRSRNINTPLRYRNKRFGPQYFFFYQVWYKFLVKTPLTHTLQDYHESFLLKPKYQWY